VLWPGRATTTARNARLLVKAPSRRMFQPCIVATSHLNLIICRCSVPNFLDCAQKRVDQPREGCVALEPTRRRRPDQNRCHRCPPSSPGTRDRRQLACNLVHPRTVRMRRTRGWCERILAIVWMELPHCPMQCGPYLQITGQSGRDANGRQSALGCVSGWSDALRNPNHARVL
jgi:hypothetical protein